jgi:hypothetical protein
LASRRTDLDEGRDGGGGKPGDVTLLWRAGGPAFWGGGPADEVSARGGGPVGTLSLRGGAVNGVLETAGDGGGNGGACVEGVIVDPHPETCRLGFVGSIGGSYAFEVLVLNDSAVTFGSAGTGGTGGTGGLG